MTKVFIPSQPNRKAACPLCGRDIFVSEGRYDNHNVRPSSTIRCSNSGVEVKGKLYAKALGEGEVWHRITNLHAGDNTVAVACGYPDMPNSPRHSGRFAPAMMFGPDPTGEICKDCLEN